MERLPGDYVQNITCEKVPRQLCSAECVKQGGMEECHETTVTTAVEVPEEVCNVNPVRYCREGTKLVPELEPVEECRVVPRENCELKFSSPAPSQSYLVTKWCRHPVQRQNNNSLFYLEEMFVT